MSENQVRPFKQLGEKLRAIRQKLHESVAEVSGAVEIDERTLDSIEQGKERPAEDILLLLINHFGMREDEAASLWQLAGYEQPRNQGGENGQQNDDNMNRSTILVMAVDPRVMYSDGVQVTANRSGVTISFSQGNGAGNPLTTAKVGMSREQAVAVIRTLQEALHRSEPKQLPSPAQPSADQASDDKQ